MLFELTLLKLHLVIHEVNFFQSLHKKGVALLDTGQRQVGYKRHVLGECKASFAAE